MKKSVGVQSVKRLTSHYVETETSSSWVVQPTKYFIRSSVLGGATVSEVWANGKKNKTFVRAAGTQLAYQIAYYSDSAALAETVLFQYTDPSGMSQRTTDKDATPAAYGDGGEGSPVEFDPLGSNAGTSSPYFEPVIYNPDPEYPQLLLFYDDSPTYVNGQRLTCTLDGFAIDCSSAFGMLGHSADIDFRNTSSWTLGQLGIFVVFNPNSGRTAPNLPNTPDGTIRVNTQQDGGRYEYYFSNISRVTQQQTPGGGGQNERTGQNIKVNETKLNQALNDCLEQQYGDAAQIKKFKVSTSGTVGSISVDINDKRYNLSYGISVYNDAATYTRQGLNALYDEFRVLGNFKTRIGNLTGFTLPASGGRFSSNQLTTSYVYGNGTVHDVNYNYSASDITSRSTSVNGNRYLLTQIHEFANSLDLLLYGRGLTGNDQDPDDTDAGEVFENCVRNRISRGKK